MDEADRYDPTMPSLDRIDPDGDYSDGNLRVVLFGINGLRGRGSDADANRIAAALTDHGSRPPRPPALKLLLRDFCGDGQRSVEL